MCLEESQKRKISFWVALLMCLLTGPIFGYFIILSIKLRNPLCCKWCGNTQNEVEYCGICHNNAAAEMKSAG
jgi:hypothetical protein